MVCLCGHWAPKACACLRPQIPRWQPSVCGPGTGCPLLHGYPWGLKLDAIRSGCASGQNLCTWWPDQPLR